MDCEMPIMDGYAATEAIRRYEERHDRVPVKIIALTAHALPVNAERCLTSGMDAVLTKPLDMGVLKSVIQEIEQEQL